MKRVLPLLVTILIITACANLATPEAPTAGPVPVTDTGAATATNPPVPPTETSMPPLAAPSDATSFPDPAAYQWSPVVTGFTSPVDIQFAGDGTQRMFIIEQAGRIHIVENGQLLDAPFLDITDRVGSGGNEQGLLGLAFRPDYKDNPYFYVNYTDKKGDTNIARFQAQGNTADPASEKDLIHLDQPFPNHNGGVLTFGPDGYLYAGLGDGGSAGDPFGNAQNKTVLLGKILRIDVDHGDPYTLPPDNPFGNEVWDYGLRNPWRISFDKTTNDLYIADVGQDAWEEVDYVPAGQGGLDFGWNYLEGSHPYTGSPPSSLPITDPVTEYSHAEGGCSITGGFVYRGAMPEWQGIYLYGDFCSGKIWGLIRPSDPTAGTPWQSQLLFETGANITTFGQDPAGEIYFADRGGTIFRLGK